MKVALIGNMNNNNFAIMRFLRSAGIVADLFLLANEINPEKNHFHPNYDTWNYKKWEPFIHHSKISEDIISAFNFPMSWVLSLRSYLRSILNDNINFIKPVSKKYVQNQFKGYTHIIGSGIMPAVLKRIKIKLSIFYPYSMGIEYIEQSKFSLNKDKLFFISQMIHKIIYNNQLEGIKSSKAVIDPDLSLNKVIYKKYNIEVIRLFVPLLFNEEFKESEITKPYVKNLIKKIKNADFSILSHARHIWVKPVNISDLEWKKINKNTDWIVKAFAKIISKNKLLDLKLILFEYGEDFVATKRLCEELGIKKHILWVPKIDRKNIMALLKYVDIGIGEFYEIKNVFWGGTAIEILSSGTPLIQGGNFTSKLFKENFDIPLPPILFANSKEEIYDKISYLMSDSMQRQQLGKKSSNWIKLYYGEKMIAKWIDLMKFQL